VGEGVTGDACLSQLSRRRANRTTRGGGGEIDVIEVEQWQNAAGVVHVTRAADAVQTA
jgi:hypothetical protein